MKYGEIILALISLLGGCGWFVSARKYRHEVRKTKAEAEREELDLSVEYVQKFNENIFEPLQREVKLLRLAIEEVGRCSHRADCPVMDKLHSVPQISTGDRDNNG